MDHSTDISALEAYRDLAQRLDQVFAEESSDLYPSQSTKDQTKDQADYQKQAQDDKAMTDKVSSDKQSQDKVSQDLSQNVPIASGAERPRYAYQGRRFASPITPELRPSLAPHALSAEADLTPNEVNRVADDFNSLLSETNRILSQS